MDNVKGQIKLALHHVFRAESQGSEVSVQFEPSRALFANIDHDVGKLVLVPFTTKVQLTRGKVQTTVVDLELFWGSLMSKSRCAHTSTRGPTSPRTRLRPTTSPLWSLFGWYGRQIQRWLTSSAKRAR